MYGFAVGAIGYGWLSEVFSIQLKIFISLGAVILLGTAFYLQERWKIE